jgi:hypothetical protein
VRRAVQFGFISEKKQAGAGSPILVTSALVHVSKFNFSEGHGIDFKGLRLNFKFLKGSIYFI